MDLIAQVLDPGSWQPWDEAVPEFAATESYRAALDRARADTGLDEAVVTGEGSIAGHRVAVVASEFGFLAGSVGVGASGRVVDAIHRATRERLPLLASPASGGTRLQEGTLAFVQMARITGALTAHRAAGLPYLVYLRNPTTGGVLASWGSLGHVTAAEPGALVGLLGPRVQRTLHGEALPPDVQTAENLHAHGLVDAVVPPQDLRDVAIRVLTVLTAPAAVESEPAIGGPPDELEPAPHGDQPVWDSVQRSRRPDRPGVRALLKLAASDVTPLSGTGAGERDDALILALARFGSAPCVLLGQDRRGQAADDLGPAALREALRGIRLAGDLGLPLVTVVDTPGAVPSRSSEEGGLAGSIARCLADLVTLRSPTCCVLLAEGGGGTALALLPADRVLCAQHGWLAPLPPEAMADILHRSPDRAADVAAQQGIGSAALLEQGIADHIVPERPDAADEPEQFMRRLGRVLEVELRALLNQPPEQRLATRATRYGAVE